MESLPVELLIEVFSHFCFHCQHPGIFPNADLDETCSGKKSLSRLCLMSKTICAVAQPILYHYYATGNTRIEIKLYQGYDGIAACPKKPDFLPQFVRTLTQRPDLALNISTMQIVRGDELVGYKSQMQTIEYLFKYSVAKNLLQEPDLPNGWLDGNFAEWRVPLRKTLHLWLATLAMVLAPRLQSLLLAIDHNAAFSDLECSPHLRLPSLRTLGLVGNLKDYHFFSPRALYAAAPNLETIYTCDGEGWYTMVPQSSYNLECKLGLPNLKRLAVSDFLPDHLGNLLLHSPKLEDLEYYWDDDHNFIINDLADMLRPVQKTLKRLCISYLPRSTDNIPVDPFPGPIVYPHAWYPPLRTLQDFPNLEELSIDCHFLYRPGDREHADRLVTLLPVSIRKLRISYLYLGIHMSLSQLAERTPESFPLLKDVTIGVAERTDPNYDSGIEKTLGLGELFEKSGIRFSRKKDLLGADARTLIPGAMPGSKLVSIPRVMDEVEDLELTDGQWYD
ncbi:hypothetical protein K445DRAFT_375442 [Daldinia sp. EC12]|nr:hypothetical protein K445DRAFT_375442 [Daldinia sp. EC12]